MSLTVKTNDLNSFGAVVMDGDLPVALCRPISIYARCDDGKLVPRAVTPEEALKNAHLFAAAPDLLSAAIKCVKYEDEPRFIYGAIASLREAIAKALGEK